VVSVDGETVAQAIDALESRYPGIRERLCEGGSLKPSLSVAVDDRIRSEGLRAKVGPESEVHFLPAIGGG
jgi:molybdopterin synthase sulfur carrier subunit